MQDLERLVVSERVGEGHSMTIVEVLVPKVERRARGRDADSVRLFSRRGKDQIRLMAPAKHARGGRVSIQHTSLRVGEGHTHSSATTPRPRSVIKCTATMPNNNKDDEAVDFLALRMALVNESSGHTITGKKERRGRGKP